MKISADDLRLVRSHLDLTQAEMAEHIGVSPRTMVNWETGGVPDSKVTRVLKVVGHDLDEAKRVQAFLKDNEDNFPPDDQPPFWVDDEPAPTQLGMTADQRRSHLLQAFTDVDLTNELKDRALRRGDRSSLWNAERMERYQKFVAPQWEYPEYSEVSDDDVRKNQYGLAAKEADKNIGIDDLPHEP